MKYTIDTENKIIEFSSLSGSEIVELAKQYPDYVFRSTPNVIYSYPTIIPYNNPITLCGTGGTSGKPIWQFGTTTNHCQGGSTLSTFSGTAKCSN